MRAPQTWHLSAGGVPIPPPPEGAELIEAIDRVRAGMDDDDLTDPRWDADNYEGWRADRKSVV